MSRLHLLIACSISVFLAQPLAAARAKTAPAIVILLEGEPLYFEGGHRHKLDLGQALGKDCEIDTPKGASVHLVLANGSSLVIAERSRLKLWTLDLPPARPRYQAKLMDGRVGLFADPEDQEINFDLGGDGATVLFKKARFELALQEGEVRVTVDQGSVQFGPESKKRLEEVGALYSCGWYPERLEKANRLPKREINEFHQRWQRSLMIHGQRKELVKNLRSLR